MYIIVITLASTIYILLCMPDCTQVSFPFCMLSLCIRAARFFLVKTVLDSLLATVENITNVKFYRIFYINW